MRIKILLLSVISVALFAACSSDDDDNVTLNQTSISLKHNETYQLKVTSGSSYHAGWASSNEYVATVNSDGLVTGQRIGEAVITYRDAQCKVIVKATSTLYEEPNPDWGATKTLIINSLGLPDYDTDRGNNMGTVIAYDSPGENVIVSKGYYFDNNEKLEIVAVLINTTMKAELETFLSERYWMYNSTAGTEGDLWNHPHIKYFTDGLMSNATTKYVTLMDYGTSCGVYYQPK